MTQPFIVVFTGDENEVKQLFQSLSLMGLESLQTYCQTNCADEGDPYAKESAAGIPRKPKKKKKEKTKKRKVITFDEVPPGTKLCTIDEACAIIGVSRTTLKTERDNGRLTDIKKGKRELRFLYNEVEFLRSWHAQYRGKG